ncbi:ribonuclease T2 family protein [Methylomonas sp. HW2-6]|uniref:ribonuclease T2 family protein n=1 Tax=Methylomonas sp. HW2-6 TaxID=3376687 RepID=UPI004041336E
MSRLNLLAVMCLTLCAALAHADCVDPKDTYDAYNEVADTAQHRPSEFYVLSYSWAPRYCAEKGDKRRPGQKDYLQCGSNARFGYILHGLWPQGTLAKPNDYPRACAGDQPKIDRALMAKYFCMTPSAWLLQHEYENHGTCMIDQNLRTPQAYFDKALALHSALRLPDQQITNEAKGKTWFVQNNPQLPEDSVYFDRNAKEWRVCYNRDFAPFPCPRPGGQGGDDSDGNNGNPDACPVKGNISGKNRKYYFVPSHPSYAGVVIDFSRGERCFDTVKQAMAAGWKKAP